MNYCLHITSAPYSEQGSLSALNFARALIEKGHRITRIFFSGNGVLNANALCVAPQDEIHLPQSWQTLGKENSIEMMVCVSSALKFGIINEQEAMRYSKENHSLLDGFELSGLGQLVDACLSNDRVLRF